jgi:hypothetical protein
LREMMQRPSVRRGLPVWQLGALWLIAACSEEAGTEVIAGGRFAGDADNVAEVGRVEAQVACSLLEACGERCCELDAVCAPSVEGGNRCVPAGRLEAGERCGETATGSCTRGTVCLTLAARAACYVVCDLEVEGECDEAASCEPLRIAGDPRAGFCVPIEGVQALSAP